MLFFFLLAFARDEFVYTEFLQEVEKSERIVVENYNNERLLSFAIDSVHIICLNSCSTENDTGRLEIILRSKRILLFGLYYPEVDFTYVRQMS